MAVEGRADGSEQSMNFFPPKNQNSSKQSHLKNLTNSSPVEKVLTLLPTS
jgi:hypothetical protein